MASIKLASVAASVQRAIPDPKPKEFKIYLSDEHEFNAIVPNPVHEFDTFEGDLYAVLDKIPFCYPFFAPSFRTDGDPSYEWNIGDFHKCYAVDPYRITFFSYTGNSSGFKSYQFETISSFPSSPVTVTLPAGSREHYRLIENRCWSAQGNNGDVFFHFDQGTAVSVIKMRSFRVPSSTGEPDMFEFFLPIEVSRQPDIETSTAIITATEKRSGGDEYSVFCLFDEYEPAIYVAKYGTAGGAGANTDHKLPLTFTSLSYERSAAPPRIYEVSCQAYSKGRVFAAVYANQFILFAVNDSAPSQATKLEIEVIHQMQLDDTFCMDEKGISVQVALPSSRRKYFMLSTFNKTTKELKAYKFDTTVSALTKSDFNIPKVMKDRAKTVGFEAWISFVGFQGVLRDQFVMATRETPLSDVVFYNELDSVNGFMPVCFGVNNGDNTSLTPDKFKYVMVTDNGAIDNYVLRMSYYDNDYGALLHRQHTTGEWWKAFLPYIEGRSAIYTDHAWSIGCSAAPLNASPLAIAAESPLPPPDVNSWGMSTGPYECTPTNTILHPNTTTHIGYYMVYVASKKEGDRYTFLVDLKSRYQAMQRGRSGLNVVHDIPVCHARADGDNTIVELLGYLPIDPLQLEGTLTFVTQIVNGKLEVTKLG